MFYSNTIELLLQFAEQEDQLEVCPHFSRLLTGIPMLPVFKNLRWHSKKLTQFDPSNCKLVGASNSFNFGEINCSMYKVIG